MKRSIRLRLQDILEAIEGIEDTAAGLTLAEYRQSWQIRRAVERGVEIISEASRHIPEDLKQRYPQIFWRKSPGSEICCGTNTVTWTTALMWRVVEKYLPELKAVIIDMLQLQKPPQSRS